jgi:phage-related holin
MFTNIFTTIKVQLILKSIIGCTLTFFLPIFPAMIAVGILISIDTIMGIIAAYNAGEKITSKKMGGAITKSFIYQFLIISAHLCNEFLFSQIPFVKISLAFLAMTEFTSIAENFQKATGKNFIKYIKQIMDEKLRGFINDKNIIDNKDTIDNKDQSTI